MQQQYEQFGVPLTESELTVLQARETGICPVREELYSQCLDELIRQVTINCAERGLLLLRVRDEMRMTIAAYQVRHLLEGDSQNLALQPATCSSTCCYLLLFLHCK